MKIIDISFHLSEKTVVWPGDPKLQIKTIASRESRNECHVYQITFSTHTGTHIDAPFHFWADGLKLTEISDFR